MICLKIAGRVANSVDPDQTPQHAAFDQSLHCLFRSICPNNQDKHVKLESNQYAEISANRNA